MECVASHHTPVWHSRRNLQQPHARRPPQGPLRRLRLIPVINIFADALSTDGILVLEPVKSGLKTMGLMNALMLTTAMALPTGLEFSELEEVRARFSDGSNYTAAYRTAG